MFITAQFCVVFNYDNLLKRIVRCEQGTHLLYTLLGIRNSKGTLDIITPAALVSNEVDLDTLALAFFNNIDNRSLIPTQIYSRKT